MRKIIHIDMDAFYASIEQRDHPEYKGRPLAVGYSGDRGVVAAASYEARKFGVRSAMPSKTAQRKCPQLIFTPARFDVYKVVSKQIMEIFREYTDLVEPLSLDEAFLDVTQNHKNIPYATLIAKDIKQKIFEQTSLTASTGISYNKFLAKIASDYNKPDGLFVIKPKDAELFLERLPIEDFFGVGKVTAKLMNQIGIKNGLDLKSKSEPQLTALFGKVGHVYYKNARGIDDREVNPNRVRKSIGAETTFGTDIESFEELSNKLKEVVEDVIFRTKKNSFLGRTITLKVKLADFRIITRSKTLPQKVTSYETLYSTSLELLKEVDISKKIRLLGVSIKNSGINNLNLDIQLRLNFEQDPEK